MNTAVSFLHKLFKAQRSKSESKI